MAKIYKIKNKKRQRKHGFLKRSGSGSGKRILKKRRQKGRKRLAL